MLMYDFIWLTNKIVVLENLYDEVSTNATYSNTLGLLGLPSYRLKRESDVKLGERNLNNYSNTNIVSSNLLLLLFC